MTPLILATALALSGPIHGPLEAPVVSPFILKDLQSPPPGAVLSPNLQKQLNEGKLCQKRTMQTLGPNGAPLKKLGELPPGLVEHAVLRVINGCPVREIVFAGQTYYLDAPAGGLQRLDPATER